MLSILIPAYNQSCQQLVGALQEQCLAEGIAYEILVADDGSTDTTARQENIRAGQMLGCRTLLAPQNRGRAATRNWLVHESKGRYLLFIDSDAQPIHPHFIHRYAILWPTEAVVCGGILHPRQLPSPGVSLRYRYEKACEPHFTAQARSRHPYQCLRSFNIMLPRAVALRYPFDENLRTYGYEDTLLGKAYERDGIAVLHIDNPLLNSDLEDNATFLRKTRESMRTLLQIQSQMQGYSSLLAAHSRLRGLCLARPLALLYRLFHRCAERNLLGSHPRVWLLQLYKLAYFCEIRRKGE